MKSLFLGIGINDAGYVVKVYETVGHSNGKRNRKLTWVCPYYTRWTNMLKRCYSKIYHEKTPTYLGCSVCDDWKYFSKFRAWMIEQDWEGKELDKDLFITGNKIYSPETCVFISRMVNCFIVERDASRGEHPIGVYWNKNRGKYLARCQNPFTNKYDYLGAFNDPQEAHKAWLIKKKELANILASIQKDERVAKALINKYENYTLNLDSCAENLK